MIPQAVLDQWSAVLPTDRILAPMTRQDVDHLLLGLLRILESQTHLDRALTDWSNGRVDDANQAINACRRVNIDAQNSIRQFAAREDRPRGDAELVIVALALEQLAGRVGVGGDAAAARANRLALSGSPADQLEGLIGFLVRQTGHSWIRV